MTGAPLPPGADAVVPIEDVAESDGVVSVPSPVRPARSCGRPRTAPAPETWSCWAGRCPGRLAVLASLGIGEVEVRRRPVVAILSTGDELVAPGDPLRPGRSTTRTGRRWRRR